MRTCSITRRNAALLSGTGLRKGASERDTRIPAGIGPRRGCHKLLSIEAAPAITRTYFRGERV